MIKRFKYAWAYMLKHHPHQAGGAAFVFHYALTSSNDIERSLRRWHYGH